ncbi:MAG: DNA translocase FtsK [Planctomycetota bacterium]
MPVALSVAEIRKRLLAERDAAADRDGAAVVAAELGVLFHEVVSLCFTVGSSLYVIDVLEDAEPAAVAWKTALVDAVYRSVFGPRLDRDRPTLNHFPREVATCWRAIENLCEWLAGVLLVVHRKHGSLDAARDLVDCERMLEIELREPGWADSVLLRGPADALLRLPESHTWCVVVLESGKPAWEADLAQAALYRLLLTSTEGQPRDLRLVAFANTVHEKPISPTEIERAEARLKEAIGRIAGVDAEAPVQPSPDWQQPTAVHRAMRESLLRVLKDYGLEATIDEEPRLGPTFIRFLVTPEAGAKVSRFTRLVEEIALGMNLKNPPLIERLGDRIAIDIERPDRRAVRFDELRGLLPARDPLVGNSRILVGVDMDGRPVFIDLAKPEHCHVLVVGTAGSGKSIWMRAAIASLVETNTPATLRLVLIDPKRNAFTAWRSSPFLRAPIVYPDETSPLQVLTGLIEEMEARYRRMAELEVDDLVGLNRRERRPTPRIVCACDEYADLVTTSDDRREIEEAIARLGAKARAAGIHLVLATQTPRREIIGGTIKANLPTCVGLRVSSETEAKIIETPGAELLLGDGDLLLRSIGEPRRLQGALLTAGRESPELVATG